MSQTQEKVKHWAEQAYMYAEQREGKTVIAAYADGPSIERYFEFREKFPELKAKLVVDFTDQNNVIWEIQITE